MMPRDAASRSGSRAVGSNLLSMHCITSDALLAMKQVDYQLDRKGVSVAAMNLHNAYQSGIDKPHCPTGRGWRACSHSAKSLGSLSDLLHCPSFHSLAS